ncbi:MAG: DUF1707 domain-containing protein [Actinomycetota bacterium]|nr:DUF1707 domain-containing protein [Actinomycetota bacterium]
MTESTALRPVDGIRCSDADRERTSTRLRDAAAAGYLTMNELDERITAAYAARYGHELDALTLDLPQPGTSAATVLATSWARLLTVLLGRHGSGWMRHRPAVVAMLLVVVVAAAAL